MSSTRYYDDASSRELVVWHGSVCSNGCCPSLSPKKGKTRLVIPNQLSSFLISTNGSLPGAWPSVPCSVWKVYRLGCKVSAVCKAYLVGKGAGISHPSSPLWFCALKSRTRLFYLDGFFLARSEWCFPNRWKEYPEPLIALLVLSQGAS